MSQYLIIAGGTIFGMLGLAHAIYTLCDIFRPRFLVPLDRSLIDQMTSAGLRLARARTNMWDAWLGFNLSHSLGLIIFSLVCVAAGASARTLELPRATLLIPVLVGVIYLVLALRFWFRVPAVGVGIATGLLFLGWLSY